MDLERTCSEGRTALLLAAENGHILVVMVLLVKGAELRHKSADGKTALVYAASNGHVETVRCFLDGGLDVNDCDGAGISKSTRPLA
jgi:ankyrin repeat protein